MKVLIDRRHRKIYTGKRGGKYYMKGGKKHYIKGDNKKGGHYLQLI
mgnify:CR=1 FL=1